MNTVSKHQSGKQQMKWLLFMLFGIPGLSACLGLAAYHFHWREDLLLRYTGQQINGGLDVLCFLSTAMVISVVVRRVVLQAKYRRH